MNSELYFLLGCIPTRIIIVLVAFYLHKDYLPYYGLLLLGPATGFLYLYFTNSRLNAPEANNHTWWKELRIFHGIFYLIAAIMAFNKSKHTWIPLAVDVIFGIRAFLHKHHVMNKLEFKDSPNILIFILESLFIALTALPIVVVDVVIQKYRNNAASKMFSRNMFNVLQFFINIMYIRIISIVDKEMADRYLHTLSGMFFAGLFFALQLNMMAEIHRTIRALLKM
jgi:hypothetical protein